MAPSDWRSTLVPKECRTCDRVVTSTSSGTPRNTVVPFAANAAAIIGKAAFFAPLTETRPRRGRPPRTTNMSIRGPPPSVVHLADEYWNSVVRLKQVEFFILASNPLHHSSVDCRFFPLCVVKTEWPTPRDRASGAMLSSQLANQKSPPHRSLVRFGKDSLSSFMPASVMRVPATKRTLKFVSFFSSFTLLSVIIV